MIQVVGVPAVSRSHGSRHHHSDGGMWQVEGNLVLEPTALTVIWFPMASGAAML